MESRRAPFLDCSHGNLRGAAAHHQAEGQPPARGKVPRWSNRPASLASGRRDLLVRFRRSKRQKAPGPIAWATYAGHRFARELDEPDIGDALPFRREVAALAAD
ncbi:hypothetical protein EOA29_06590 [Mesorhizobium sp. M1E.F.Ca.ET.063.01.1.1]|nr:hypothetical protein EOA29_06590 [Mesorhizobium sp. M1E.F.Ca.ET.063.01.1.1]